MNTECPATAHGYAPYGRCTCYQAVRPIATVPEVRPITIVPSLGSLSGVCVLSQENHYVVVAPSYVEASYGAPMLRRWLNLTIGAIPTDGGYRNGAERYGWDPNTFGVVAGDPEYQVKITVGGDEIALPFHIWIGRDYLYGDNLNAVAERIAHDVVTGKYAMGEDATVTIYPCVPLTGDFDTDCSGDDEPMAIASATVYAR